MRHELDIDRMTPDKLDAYFKEHEPQEGDELELKSSMSEEGMVLAVISLLAIVILYYFKRQKDQQEGENKLKELFERTSVEELEELMEQEYGIKMSLEQKGNPEGRFQEEMYQLSEEGLNRAWDEDEPDISDVPIKEANPNYQPKRWKKGRS